MKRIKKHIFEKVAARELSQEDARAMLLELEAGRDDSGGDSAGDIAVIGIGLRFPGARTKEQFWNNLVGGVCSIGDLSSVRKEDLIRIVRENLEARLIYECLTLDESRMADLRFVHRGYLDEIDKFDAGFFGIPPKEAKFIDPEQRIFLETAYAAFEDAGYGGDRLGGKNVGMYVGKDESDSHPYRDVTVRDQLHFTGSITSILSNRLPYLKNFSGPSMVIDTACSSGLVAIHLACQALKNLECDYALAGGVQVNLFTRLDEESTYSSLVESKRARVKTFDKDADGTVWGEGAGALLLKPLKRALEDRDQVYAVIKGGAVNCDGASNGITAPNAEAQTDLLLRAWKNARIDPQTLSYLEAHGTGTNLGDPIEVKGLTNALRQFTDKKQFCGMGSVKPNIGHLVAASGPASVIKVILALQNEKLPPSLNFDIPNPYIDFLSIPTYVVDRPTDWKRGHTPRRAGISAFGISGTNCHLVLEEGPARVPEDEKSSARRPRVMTLSAKSQGLLLQLVREHRDFLASHPGLCLDDVSHTLGSGRGHYEYRAAAVVDSVGQAVESWDLMLTTAPSAWGSRGLHFGRHVIVPEQKKTRLEFEVTERELKDRDVLVRELTDQARIVSGDLYRSLVERLAEAYVLGASVDWDRLYDRPFKLSLPVYPFERTRHWAPIRKRQVVSWSPDTGRLHPLVDQCLLKTDDRQVFGTRLAVRDCWVLSEHVIGGRSILPGTSYIEIAREVCARVLGARRMEIRNLVFLKPCVVEPEGQVNLQVVVSTGSNAGEFRIISQSGEDGPWNLHAQGEALPMEDEPAAAGEAGLRDREKRLEELRERCGLGRFELDLRDKGAFVFGPRWLSPLCRVLTGADEIFFEIEVSERFLKEMDDYGLHPAVLDICANIMTWTLPMADAVFLPYMYGRLMVLGPMPGRFSGHIRLKSQAGPGVESVLFDFEFFDGAARPFLSAQDYAIKRVPSELVQAEGPGASDPRTDLYHTISWKESPSGTVDPQPAGGPILVLHDDSALSAAFLDELRRRVPSVIEAVWGAGYDRPSPGRFVLSPESEHFQRLFEDLADEAPAHCLVLDGRAGIGEGSEAVETVCRSFRLVKALVLRKHTGRTRLTLVAQGVFRVLPEDGGPIPEHAAAFALARVAGHEYEQLDVQVLDVDAASPAETVLREVLASDRRTLAALRNGRRYVQQIAPLPVMPAGKSPIVEGGVYLITGGAGGIGLQLALHLATLQKVRLALVNRSALPPKEKWRSVVDEGTDLRLAARLAVLLEIEACGSLVDCWEADVSSPERMSAVLSQIRGRWGNLQGVFHAAGVAGDGYLVTKTQETFAEVVRPKVGGTALLDHLTLEDGLDFMVLFSSVATLFHSPGQGDYTAGNAYLDAFCEWRNAQGRRTITIDWPLWKGIGMAADHQVSGEGNVLLPLDGPEAMAALDRILANVSDRVVVGRIDFGVLADEDGELPLEFSQDMLHELHRVKNRRPQTRPKPSETFDTKSVRVLGLEDVKTGDLHRRVAEIWAATLEAPEINIFHTFYEMGGDSILATQLFRRMNQEFPQRLNIADIFSYPSVDQLSNYLAGQLPEEKRSEALDVEAAPAETEDETLMRLLGEIESGKDRDDRNLKIISGMMEE